VDSGGATLIGRAWVPKGPTNPLEGPSVVAVCGQDVLDLSGTFTTCAELLDSDDPVAEVKEAIQQANILCSHERLFSNSLETKRSCLPRLLSPIDLQCIKACGVTFAESFVERLIDEQSQGDVTQAEHLRDRITKAIGTTLSKIQPGSPKAQAVIKELARAGINSAYVEVALGPDAEVFTKSQVLSSVGFGDEIGIHPSSSWNNPEPEIVLISSPAGKVVGVTLGNDVNLRDIEGRSSLLLGKAKDNNASCALGPFIRLVDSNFTIDDVRSAEVSLKVIGEDGFTLNGQSSMKYISRDILDLVEQTIGVHHQYPDGIALMTGTLFAPTEDRAS
ncbi:uncharacterized protein METZ01_LOCUS197580, partial [marine metagenome]